MIDVAVASPPGGAGAPREEAPRPPPPPAPRNGTPPSKHDYRTMALMAMVPPWYKLLHYVSKMQP